MRRSKVKFLADFNDIEKKYECPKWFQDGKFGIWSHWGPQSVPMAGDWYARNMYREGTPQYYHHIRHFGHPSQNGYAEICENWRAEKFDPERLMELYVKCGAKYFVAQAMHHDNFFNYPSEVNPFNSMNVGPHKDILGMWKNAAQKYNIPFGVSEHLAASYTFLSVSMDCDTYGKYAGITYAGCGSNLMDFYKEDKEKGILDIAKIEAISPKQWYTTNKHFQEYWLHSMKELIDKYEPELIYSDGTIPFGIVGESDRNDVLFAKGLEMISYLYNQSLIRNGENLAVYTQKDMRSEIALIGILDRERSQLSEISDRPWQTDTCLGGWFYDDRAIYKDASHVIEILVDVVSKNGSLLLNVLQKPDGTLDEETKYVLEQIGSWLKCCGEGIYGTRPWKIYGEGNSKVIINGLQEDKVNWTEKDIRYTCKDNHVFAFIMGKPESNRISLKSFKNEDKIQSVKLLGGMDCNFTRNSTELQVALPDQLPTKLINCLKITLKR